MKRLEVRIRPDQIDALEKALLQVGYPTLPLMTIDGGGARGVRWTFQGLDFNLEFLPNVQLEIVGSNAVIEKLQTGLSAKGIALPNTIGERQAQPLVFPKLESIQATVVWQPRCKFRNGTYMVFNESAAP